MLENRDLKQLRLSLPSRQAATTANPPPAEHINTKRNRDWPVNLASTKGCLEDFVEASFFLAFAADCGRCGPKAAWVLYHREKPSGLQCS